MSLLSPDGSSLVAGKVSIVIPCYNYGRYLLETLASIDAVKSDAIHEVIVVDDGSTDRETVSVLAALSPSRCRVERTENRGLASARNTGIRLARGEYILPLDADNLLRDAYAEHGIAILKSDASIGVVYGDAQYFGDRTGPWVVRDYDFSDMVCANYIDACALFRKAVWEDVGGYDEKMPAQGWEDWDFWLRIGVRGWRFHHLAMTAFDYRVHAESMLSETKQHTAALEEYIFSKPHNRVAGLLRNREMQMRAMGMIPKLARSFVDIARPVGRKLGLTSRHT